MQAIKDAFAAVEAKIPFAVSLVVEAPTLVRQPPSLARELSARLSVTTCLMPKLLRVREPKEPALSPVFCRPFRVPLFLTQLRS